MKEVHSSRGRQWSKSSCRCGSFRLAVAAVGERAGIAGVVQHPQHGVVLQRFPVQLTLVGPFADAAEGNIRPAWRNVLTQAVAEPVAAKVSNRYRMRLLHSGIGVER